MDLVSSFLVLGLMRSFRRSIVVRRVLIASFAACCWLCFGAVGAFAQDYLSAGGSPTFSTPIPVEMGFTDTSNGNLHLEIPVGSFPQRASGQPLVVKFYYNSNTIWGTSGSGSGLRWFVNPTFWSETWVLAASGGPIDFWDGAIDCQWLSIDSMGTTRYYTISGQDPSTGTTCHGNGYATDSSGYKLIQNAAAIFAPDGTLISYYPTVYTGPQCPSGGAEDSNGNCIIAGITNHGDGTAPLDTLGRSIVGNWSCAAPGIGACQFSVINSQGSTNPSIYTVTPASINVITDFGQAGITECTQGCTMPVVQSINLPDGSAYTFKYDCDSTATGQTQVCSSPGGQTAYYGLLTSMTLPTGEVINYSYTNFKDSYANHAEWLTTKSSSLGGYWSYSPQVLTACSSNGVGCKEQVTITAPTYARSIITYTLDNGAWPTEIQNYDTSGSLLSTVYNTYDFSQACPFTGCDGAAYIRLLNSQTTLPSAGGSVSKQTAYSYDSPITGNVTAVQEWGYYPGSSPSFPSTPDRATYTTYYRTGTNNIDRPLSVTICSNSGSDTNCPGGGSRAQQTLYTYDQYSGSSSLSAVTGIANHNDASFGTSFTQRGNPTQIQYWVSGSQYLTSSLSYDTTGQITSSLDPANRVTTYSYQDSFFNDNGSNPGTPYSPTAPTNAYPTRVTSYLGTEQYTYYWGSGKQASYTDWNNDSFYQHFVDSLDRPTGASFPIGWELATYPSATESDVYDSIGDTAPSVGCTSCRHSQYILDAMGRQSSRKLVNNPIGTVSIDTAYDTAGRAQTISHPYVSGPVYESYSYDSFNRTTQVTHPDSQALNAIYGQAVSTEGALGAQQGATTTFGYGYPSLQTDESGKQKEEWVDAFGRIIEVDQPGAPVAGTQATGTITITGSEESKYSNPCLPHGSCPITIYDSGQITASVNGYVVTTTYEEGSTASGLLAVLASGFNSDSSPVTASVSGDGVVLTSKAVGSIGDYSLSASRTSNEGLASFPTTASGSTLTGGSGGGPTSFGTPLVTNYLYTPLDQLTWVTQGGETRTFLYDGLGRVIQETTPEAGTITVSYTSSGSLCSGDPSNICSITDAKGQTTTYTYDSLNRVTGKTNSAGTISYSYDQGGAGAHAIGRLTKMTDPSGSETYTYDADGRITSLQKVVGSNTFTTSYQYLGGTDEITQITYPSGRIVQQGYNQIGQLCVVAGQASPTSCGSYSSPYAVIPGPANGYDAVGNMLQINYGNGVVGTFAFSPNRDQLTCIDYEMGNPSPNGCQKTQYSLFSTQYWYLHDSTNCPTGSTGNNGQIQCITDGVQPGRTLAYTYDPVFRLLTAQTTGSTAYPQWAMSESYDQYGNRACQSVTSGSGPSFCQSFTIKNQPSGYTYDADGNLTVEPLAPNNNYTYDANNRLVSLSGGGTGSYVYDGNGMRVQQSANGTTTVDIYSGSKIIAQYQNGAAPNSPTNEFIYADSDNGSRLLAVVSGGNTNYMHHDHLSVRLITNSSGSDIGEQGHYPFGESWYQNNATTQWRFTTYQRDQESGLDYALARFYNSRVGGFCSVDPLEGNPDEPLSWNRYSYAENDPINLVDPSGKGFLTWLFDALAILADIFSGGATIPETIQLGIDLQGISDLSVFAAVVQTGKATEQQGQQQPQQNTPPSAGQEGGAGPRSTPWPPPTPPGYKKCDPLTFTIRGVGGHEAQAPGAAGNYPNKPGNVAYNPNDFGLTDSQAKELDKSKTPILFSPDWNNAQSAQAGVRKVPKGLPVSTDQTLAGRDTLGGPGVDRSTLTNTIDVYGYKTKRVAWHSTRDVPTVVFYPIGKPGDCPQK